MPRILMTGAAGGIGTSLRKLLPPIYPDLLLSDRAAPADLASQEKFKAAELSDPAAVEKAVLEARPEIVLNAAAYTAVDAAETDGTTAAAVNAQAAPSPAVTTAQRATVSLTHSPTSSDRPFRSRRTWCHSRRTMVPRTFTPDTRSPVGRTAIKSIA